jgi:hypothetical protein
MWFLLCRVLVFVTATVLSANGRDSVVAQQLHAALYELTPAERSSNAARIVLLRRARQDYKHIETLVESYTPVLVNVVNGPTTGENDDEPMDNRLVPKGFPLLESILFPAPDRAHMREVAPTVNTR